VPGEYAPAAAAAPVVVAAVVAEAPEVGVLEVERADGMQGYGPGGTVSIVHNYLDSRTQNGSGMNGTIFFADGWNGNVTITKNFLMGGAFSLRLHESGHYWVNGNRVLAGSYGNGPSTTTYGMIEQWTDNRLRNADGSDGATFSQG
jgi:hypothetical protein